MVYHTSLEKQRDMHTGRCLQSNNPRIRPEKQKRGDIKPPCRKYKGTSESAEVLDLTSREMQMTTFAPIRPSKNEHSDNIKC